MLAIVQTILLSLIIMILLKHTFVTLKPLLASTASTSSLCTSAVLGFSIASVRVIGVGSAYSTPTMTTTATTVVSMELSVTTAATTVPTDVGLHLYQQTDMSMTAEKVYLSSED